MGKPVKWIGDRTEHFLIDSHGRDNIATAEMAMDANGKFLAMRVDLLANMGAYLSQYAPYIPDGGITMSTGLYDIPALYAFCRGIYTNTVPVDAYRGAGRPEAAYLIERLVDVCGRDTGLGPVEIRKRNFIQPSMLPYETKGGRIYDSGEFDGHLDKALSLAKYTDFPARAAAAKAAGKVRGIGFATYVEACAFPGTEGATVTLNEDGTATLLIGTQTNGQGHATAYAQFIAGHLGLDYDKINVIQGDTDKVPSGEGTGGSRSIPLGAVSVDRASIKLAGQLRKTAAARLEARPDELELADGTIRVAGTNRGMTLAELARSTPEKSALTAYDESFEQPEPTYPNGTHMAEVEIDPETGVTAIVGYWIVDDFRRDREPDPARGSGPRRHRSGHRPGALRAHGLRRDRPAPDRDLPGLRHAARRQRPVFPFRDAERPLAHQCLRHQRRGRGGSILQSGGDECHESMVLPPYGSTRWTCSNSLRVGGDPGGEVYALTGTTSSLRERPLWRGELEAKGEGRRPMGPDLTLPNPASPKALKPSPQEGQLPLELPPCGSGGGSHGPASVRAAASRHRAQSHIDAGVCRHGDPDQAGQRSLSGRRDRVLPSAAFALIPVFIWVAGRMGQRRSVVTVFRTTRPSNHLIRSAAGVTGMFLGFAALSRLPIADATAIGYASPLMAVAFAVLLLKEKVHVFRWTAVGVGLVGVLIILSDYVVPGAGGHERSVFGAAIGDRGGDDRGARRHLHAIADALRVGGDHRRLFLVALRPVRVPSPCRSAGRCRGRRSTCFPSSSPAWAASPKSSSRNATASAMLRRSRPSTTHR